MARPDRTITNPIELSSDWIRTHLPDITSPQHLRLATGYDDSMEETIFQGDVLFVDSGIREIKSNGVYVFSFPDQLLLIRRVQPLPSGALNILCDNRRYPPYVIEPDERPNMHIHGRVAGAWNWHRL